MKSQQTVQPSAPVGGVLWLKWVLANAIRWAITFVPSFIASSVNEALGASMGRNAVEIIVSVLTLLLGILIAILVGMLQWFVLRRYVGWANQWWLVTSIGWFVGGCWRASRPGPSVKGWACTQGFMWHYLQHEP